MAFYLDAIKVKKANPHPIFDKTYSPGEIVPNSGLYYCTQCNSEIAANATDPFPPQNKAQHSNHDGPIEWKLLVLAEY